MRGATKEIQANAVAILISTHTPHAGRDRSMTVALESIRNFYSHAPCGARLELARGASDHGKFLLTRPMRGATRQKKIRQVLGVISTHTPHAGRDCSVRRKHDVDSISTHTPHAGRDRIGDKQYGVDDISTHTPHAGRDTGQPVQLVDDQISTHTPHAGRDRVLTELLGNKNISTHTPHAGRDCDDRCSQRILSNFYSHAPCGARQLHIVYVTPAPPIYKRRTQKL